MTGQGLTRVLCTSLFLLLSAKTAGAGRARFHYVPDVPGRVMSLKPAVSIPSDGEAIQGLRVFRQSGYHPAGPAQSLTLQNPRNHLPITVAVALPEGNPRIEHRINQVIYNYGIYSVEIHFLPDGTVDVIYNSGCFRAI